MANSTIRNIIPLSVLLLLVMVILSHLILWIFMVCVTKNILQSPVTFVRIIIKSVDNKNTYKLLSKLMLFETTKN